ncbi:phytoene desaturase family protein [Streptomyces odontomachi]|uniref:phytoene desaturase family protein n=1 Tax=Streptomyces odontomachi TaxID=2944940 RepID=UPI00210C6DF5|nr:NAD(P)-binding protein [Streptomyces sp. ODS25]
MTAFPAHADVVFVGAGHNALVAAAYLLDAGRSVCLFEQMPRPGGWVQTAELGAPGFLHDRWSALHPAFVGGPVWAELGPDLERHGLEYVTAPLATASSLPGGRTAIVPVDPRSFAEELDRLGERAGWDAATAEAFADRVLAEAEAHVPGLSGLVLERHLTTPADLAAQSPNAGPGDHGAGENSLQQALTQRPIPAHRGGHRTLLPGAWLIGAATWPGPAVSGASGRAVARALIAAA